MKKIIFIILAVFTFYSCASDEVGVKQISKERMMNSWAWKIFIFTDEGEFTAVEKAKSKFDSTAKLDPVFVQDFLEIYEADNVFLNYQRGMLNNSIVYSNLTERKY